MVFFYFCGGKVRNSIFRYAERSAAESLQEARLFAASVLLERNSIVVYYFAPNESVF